MFHNKYRVLAITFILSTPLHYSITMDCDDDDDDGVIVFTDSEDEQDDLERSPTNAMASAETEGIEATYFQRLPFQFYGSMASVIQDTYGVRVSMPHVYTGSVIEIIDRHHISFEVRKAWISNRIRKDFVRLESNKYPFKLTLSTDVCNIPVPNPLIEYTIFVARLCDKDAPPRTETSEKCSCMRCRNGTILFIIDAFYDDVLVEDVVCKFEYMKIKSNRVKSLIQIAGVDESGEWCIQDARLISQSLTKKDQEMLGGMLHRLSWGLQNVAIDSPDWGMINNFLPYRALANLHTVRDVELFQQLLLAVPEVCVHSSLLFEILYDTDHIELRSLLYKLWCHEMVATATEVHTLRVLRNALSKRGVAQKHEVLRQSLLERYEEIAYEASGIDLDRLERFSTSSARYGQGVVLFENSKSNADEYRSAYHMEFGATSQWIPEGKHWRVTKSMHRLMNRFSDAIKNETVKFVVVHIPHMASLMHEITQYITPISMSVIVIAPNEGLANYASRTLAPITVHDFWTGLRNIAIKRPSQIVVLWANMLGIEWWLLLMRAHKTHSMGVEYSYCPTIHAVGNEVSAFPTAFWSSSPGASHYGCHDVFSQLYHCAQNSYIPLHPLGTSEIANTPQIIAYRAWASLMETIRMGRSPNVDFPNRLDDITNAFVNEDSFIKDDMLIVRVDNSWPTKKDTDDKTTEVESTVRIALPLLLYTTGARIGGTTGTETKKISICNCYCYPWIKNCSGRCFTAVDENFYNSCLKNPLIVGAERQEPRYVQANPLLPHPKCICGNVRDNSSVPTSIFDHHSFCFSQTVEKDRMFVPMVPHYPSQSEDSSSSSSRSSKIPISWHPKGGTRLLTASHYTGAPIERTLLVIGGECTLLDLMKAIQLSSTDTVIAFPRQSPFRTLRQCIKRVGNSKSTFGTWLSDRLCTVADIIESVDPIPTESRKRKSESNNDMNLYDSKKQRIASRA
jgi:hypothetical protein